MKLKITKQVKATIDAANTVIHRENLYVAVPEGKRRVINAHAVNGLPVVEDLYTGTTYALGTHQFSNGYGSTITF